MSQSEYCFGSLNKHALGAFPVPRARPWGAEPIPFTLTVRPQWRRLSWLSPVCSHLHNCFCAQQGSLYCPENPRWLPVSVEHHPDWLSCVLYGPAWSCLCLSDFSSCLSCLLVFTSASHICVALPTPGLHIYLSSRIFRLTYTRTPLLAPHSSDFNSSITQRDFPWNKSLHLASLVPYYFLSSPYISVIFCYLPISPCVQNLIQYFPQK